MRILAIAAAALAISLAACGEKATGENLVAPIAPAGTGTYTMRTLDGQFLPSTDSVYHLTLLSASADLKSDGTYVEAASYEDGTFGERHGTWLTSGDSLTVTQSDGQVFKGTLIGGTLTVEFGGHTGVYQSFQ